MVCPAGCALTSNGAALGTARPGWAMTLTSGRLIAAPPGPVPWAIAGAIQTEASSTKLLTPMRRRGMGCSKAEARRRAVVRLGEASYRPRDGVKTYFSFGWEGR